MKTRKARGQVRRFFRRGIACLLALTWTHTPEYLPSITDRLAALCLWNGSGASNLLYQVTLWGSVILTVYSGAVYCAGARKFLQR